ncbi:hypothetical protein IMSHALPRED_004572 [Imshaugia aleurites]|uniref:Uncharacterized protein n=1 Tax=Imshaugia aleurites TaxID=172621 RepID=A0A8H3FC07_9LECA|nr:hypothetical protein IMSHALPRED_004572 [Imshaugia aleurites]
MSSNAFHNQFSTIIRLEARLQGDHSEDVTGPAHQFWVLKHLAEVAEAQGFTSRPLMHTTTLNVHARELSTPHHAQATTTNRSEHITPWYDSFNLADQGVCEPSGPQAPAVSPSVFTHPADIYSPFDHTELAAYRAVIRAQLLSSSDAATPNPQSAPRECVNHASDPVRHRNLNPQIPQRPSTPRNNFPRGYPSTPPNRSARHHHRRQTSQLDFLPDHFTHNATLRASTEPLAEPTMTSLTAPDHYKPFEVYALDVQIGDYIQSVKNPGEVTDHYPCSNLDHAPIGEHNARPVSPNGGLRIQFKGADGTVRTKVFNGLEKVQVLREVLGKEVKREG